MTLGFSVFVIFTAFFRFLPKFLTGFIAILFFYPVSIDFILRVHGYCGVFLRFCGFLSGPKCPLIKRLDEYIIPNEYM